MTNYEFLQSLSLPDLARFLESHSVTYEIWDDWFQQTYCDHCPSEEAFVPALGSTAECAYCELHNKCKFFPDHASTLSPEEVCTLWLRAQAPTEEPPTEEEYIETFVVEEAAAEEEGGTV